MNARDEVADNELTLRRGRPSKLTSTTTVTYITDTIADIRDAAMLAAVRCHGA